MYNRFRPQDISKRYIIRQRRITGVSESYNWQTRIRWYPAGWGFNKQVLGRVFARLHYLACHAPAPVQRQWRPAYNKFCDRYLAQKGRASVRYLNKYTAHAWL
jgi:hypothetical protein